MLHTDNLLSRKLILLYFPKQHCVSLFENLLSKKKSIVFLFTFLSVVTIVKYFSYVINLCFSFANYFLKSFYFSTACKLFICSEYYPAFLLYTLQIFLFSYIILHSKVVLYRDLNIRHLELSLFFDCAFVCIINL